MRIRESKQKNSRWRRHHCQNLSHCVLSRVVNLGISNSTGYGGGQEASSEKLPWLGHPPGPWVTMPQGDPKQPPRLPSAFCPNSSPHSSYERSPWFGRGIRKVSRSG